MSWEMILGVVSISSIFLIAFYSFMFKQFIKPQWDRVREFNVKHQKELINNVVTELRRISKSYKTGFNISVNYLNSLEEDDLFKKSLKHLDSYSNFSKILDNIKITTEKLNSNLDRFKGYLLEKLNAQSLSEYKKNFLHVMWEIIWRLISKDTITEQDYNKFAPEIDNGIVTIWLDDEKKRSIFMEPIREGDLDKIYDFLSKLISDGEFQSELEGLKNKRKDLDKYLKDFRDKIENVLQQYERKGKLRGRCGGCAPLRDYLIE